MRICILVLSIFLTSSLIVLGQGTGTEADKEAAYTRAINSRAEKIVNSLGISDSLKAKHATTLIAGHYRNLNSVYTERDDQIKIARQKIESKELIETQVKSIENTANEKIAVLHKEFLSTLSATLSPEQVVKVKDGLTYNVLSVTYNAYVDMIPTLKNEEKEQMMKWLVEAREIAMDAESSEMKHWWFGKYKGRINNYLSAQGYNINEEREAWEKRKNVKQPGTH
jgi:hypothetical protein